MHALLFISPPCAPPTHYHLSFVAAGAAGEEQPNPRVCARHPHRHAHLLPAAHGAAGLPAAAPRAPRRRRSAACRYVCVGTRGGGGRWMGTRAQGRGGGRARPSTRARGRGLVVVQADFSTRRPPFSPPPPPPPPPFSPPRSCLRAPGQKFDDAEAPRRAHPPKFGSSSQTFYRPPPHTPTTPTHPPHPAPLQPPPSLRRRKPTHLQTRSCARPSTASRSSWRATVRAGFFGKCVEPVVKVGGVGGVEEMWRDGDGGCVARWADALACVRNSCQRHCWHGRVGSLMPTALP